MHKSVHLISPILSFVLFNAVNFVRVEDADAELFAQKINEYGSDLLNGLYVQTDREDNLLVSPVNTYTALALLHLGAGAKTRDELAVIMKLSDMNNSIEIHRQLKAVTSKLLTKLEGHKYYETILSNGIFVGNDIPIKKSYVHLADKYYASVAKNVNFSDSPQESTNVINKWVSNSTKGRICEFYDAPISPRTFAVLISALYFNAKWMELFSPNNTKNEIFKISTTKIIETPMMNRVLPLVYESDHRTLRYDSISLPYAGNEYEMKIYRRQHQEHGDQGNLAHLFRELTQRRFHSSNVSKLMVDLKLPKMRFSWKKSVVSALKLKDIFENPDLSEMTSSKNLKISNMTHATELEVNEKGTTLAAATAVQISVTSPRIIPQNEPIKFHIDRPFLLAIRHEPTGAILFAGIIREPIQ